MVEQKKRGEEADDRVTYRTFMSRQTKRSVNETSLATAGAAHVGLIGLQMAPNVIVPKQTAPSVLQQRGINGRHCVPGGARGTSLSISLSAVADTQHSDM